MEPLITAMSDPRLRTTAMEMLTLIGDETAVEPIARTLGEDKDDPARIVAARSLGDFKDARAVAPLIATMSDRKENGIVRVEAAGSLGKIGDARAVEPLVSVIRDPQATAIGLREKAVAVLGRFRDRRAVEPLMGVLRECRKSTECSFAAESLGEIGDPRAVGPLVAALSWPEGDVSTGSYQALKKITGQDFGRDHRAWRAWWQKTKEKTLPSNGASWRSLPR